MFFFILATLSYFRVLATIKHSSFSPHLRSHPCAHHMPSCVATSGSPLRRRSTMLSSVSPITSLSSTFSNYPRPLMVGQQRRCVKPFLLASARIGPSCRLMGVQNYHVLFRSHHALVLPCPLSTIKHSSFFAPYTLSPLRPSHALLCGNEWVAVAETKYDALVHRPNHVSVINLQQLSTSFDGRTAKKACENLSPSFYTH